MRSPIPLRRFLSLQFAFVAGLPMLFIGALVWLFLLPELRANSHLQQKSMARSIAGQISAHLQGGERQMAALAEFMRTRWTLASVQLSDLLDAECGDGEFFETIYLVP